MVTGVGLVCAAGDRHGGGLAEPPGRARAASARSPISMPPASIAASPRKSTTSILSHWVDKKELKKMGRFIQLALAATDFAMSMAAWRSPRTSPKSTGVYVASGIGGFDVIEREHSQLLQGGPGRISPFFIPAAIINLASGHDFHSLRRARPEFRHGHGLLGFGARRGRFVSPDRARRRRSDDLRRHRSRDHSHGHRRIRRHEGAFHAQ